MRTERMTGYVLWEGVSLIDRQTPIVAIATMESSNTKTGNMIQTWILPQFTNPAEAIEHGQDSAVCGKCPHRPLLYRERGVSRCYVDVARAPLSVWRAYHRGVYEHVSTGKTPRWAAKRATRALAPTLADVGAGRAVRVGAWGDPGAVPVHVWRELLSKADREHCTGYTHQWRSRPALRLLVMASVDSEEESATASAMGWRYFRIGLKGERPGDGEIACPASTEMGHRTTCERCGLCRGAAQRDGARYALPSIMIQAH